MKTLIQLIAFCIIPYFTFAHQITVYSFDYQEEECAIQYRSGLFHITQPMPKDIHAQFELFTDYALQYDAMIMDFLRGLGEHFYYLELNRSEQIEFVHLLIEEIYTNDNQDWRWFIKALLAGKIMQTDIQIYRWLLGEEQHYTLVSTQEKGIEHQKKSLKRLWKSERLLLSSCPSGTPIDSGSLEIFDFYN